MRRIEIGRWHTWQSAGVAALFEKPVKDVLAEKFICPRWASLTFLSREISNNKIAFFDMIKTVALFPYHHSCTLTKI